MLHTAHFSITPKNKGFLEKRFIFSNNVLTKGHFSWRLKFSIFWHSTSEKQEGAEKCAKCKQSTPVFRVDKGGGFTTIKKTLEALSGTTSRKGKTI
jgi:hypothetical protein